MAQKIIQMQMRHLYFNLKDLFSNRKGFVILTSLLRFKNKSREFREYIYTHPIYGRRPVRGEYRILVQVILSRAFL